jgi:3-dehydroquinate dehydratase-2
MQLIAVVNGPNLNLLGSREPAIYGEATWEEIRKGMEEKAREIGVELEFFQSNHEGAVIDHLQELAVRAQGLIINPGALSHYSYCLRDALASLNLPVIEVHITNIYAREEWRSHSVMSSVVKGVISGLGSYGYEMALLALSEWMKTGG